MTPNCLIDFTIHLINFILLEVPWHPVCSLFLCDSGGTMDPELEQKIYEFRPFLYFCLAIVCIVLSRDSRLLLVSGLLFGAASGMVYYVRFISRTYKIKLRKK